MIFSVINQKGGVAKTTTALNIAAAWAKSKIKVLLIDVDPQSSATKAVFGDCEFEKTIYDVLINKLPPEEAVVSSKQFGFDVIPSEIMLSGLDVQIAAHFGRERLLKKRLDLIKRKYQAIIIDCPPSLGLITINALMASRDIIIPICPEYFSAKGLQNFFCLIEPLCTSFEMWFYLMWCLFLNMLVLLFMCEETLVFDAPGRSLTKFPYPTVQLCGLGPLCLLKLLLRTSLLVPKLFR